MIIRTLCTIVLLSTGAFAQSISLPGSLTVATTNSTGSSFIYSGTLTQAATISLNASGAACEQGATYCTNPAGVVTVAGSSGVGAVSSFTGPVGGFGGTYNFGSLIMTVSGVGSIQIFGPTSTNGLGSFTPPSSISVGTSLSALGFPAFSVTNPTITFTVADNNYGDNSGGFTVTSGAALPSTPAPATLVLVILGLAALTFGFWFRPRARTL